MAYGLRLSSGLSAAFTLVEMLVVMAVIIVLVGLTLGVTSYVNRIAVESRIRTEIKALETALESFKADNGSYPPTDQPTFDAIATRATGATAGFNSGFTGGSWSNAAILVSALWTNPSRQKIYYDFKPNQISTSFTWAVGVPVAVDPMGRPYGYLPANPRVNPQTFDLFSAGIDGAFSYPTVTSTNDDIGNWQR